MKKQTLVLIMTISAALFVVVALTAVIMRAVIGTDEAASAPPQTESAPPAGDDRQPQEPDGEPEEEPLPVLTLADVRTVELTDVSSQEVWADCVRYTVYEGILQEEDGQFAPDTLVTHVDLAQALANLTGDDAAEEGLYMSVTSSDSTEVLQEGAMWSAGPLNIFIPEGQEDVPITRAEAAFYMHQYVLNLYDAHDEVESGILDYSGDLTSYKDGDKVPLEYAQSVSWALDQGFLAGMVSDTIYADLPVTRAQLAEALVAFAAKAQGVPLAVELAGQLQIKIVESASEANHEQLQAAVDAAASKYGAVGVQVAVIENGVVTDAYTYGWSVKGSAPMTEENKLRVASITKVAVGMAAMTLREQGYIDLDESIGTYWGFPVRNPYFPDSPITIRTLLSHTSSIIVYGDDVSRQRSSIESRLRSGGFSRTEPGNILSWNYNNYAFSVLGMTLEKVSGQYLDQVMDDAFWDIMEIDAAFESGNIDATDQIATLYYHGGGVSRSQSTQASYQRPSSPAQSGSSFAGGLTISAVDLAKMAALLANDGYYQGIPLLSEESVELMETRYEYQLADGTYQALPLRTQDNLFGRDRIYYHTGSAYGVFNCMSYDPESRDGVVVLTVGASGVKTDRNIYSICSEISQTIYDTIAR